MDLSEKTVLVTGASRNIGRAIAMEMAALGADVGITAHRNEEGCAETVERVRETGSNGTYATGDLGDPSDVDRLVSSIRSELGSIDVLVNNAAIRPRKPFLEVDVEDVDRVNEVNLRGAFLLTQQVVPDMIERNEGSIITILGTFVYAGASGFSHSFASKAATAGLVRQLATEFGADGIRVNGVAPGSIDTIGAHDDDSIADQIVSATPLGRQGEPDEIADACCFLASDRASFITGQVLHVNGGLYPTPNVVS